MENESWTRVSQGRTPIFSWFKTKTVEQRVGQSGRQTKGTFFVWVVTFIGKQNRGLIRKGALSSYWWRGCGWPNGTLVARVSSISNAVWKRREKEKRKMKKRPSSDSVFLSSHSLLRRGNAHPLCVVSGKAKSHIVQRILPSFEPLRRREPLSTPLK